MFRSSTLLFAAAIVLPLPAFAAEDCAARIAAIENHPAFAEQLKDKDAGAKSDIASESESKDAVVESDITSESASSEYGEQGVAVEESGGTTVYQAGGPAGPRESWFTTEEDTPAAFGHISAAKVAYEAGDAATCIEEVEQAEKVFARETKEEQENEQQAN